MDYENLGVSNTASDLEIKKAYSKLCLQYHPDKGGDVDKFIKIQESYDRLTFKHSIANDFWGQDPLKDPELRIHSEYEEGDYIIKVNLIYKPDNTVEKTIISKTINPNRETNTPILPL